MHKILISLVSVLMTLMVVAGCKPSLPRKVVSEGKMENILYDYQLAQSVSSMDPDRQVLMEAYKRGILEKYDISEEELDSSFSYYMRHTDRLKKVYEKVYERLDNEAQALGASSSERSKYASLSATGDTADVWTERRSMILMPQPPYNQSSYTIAADTSYRAGDRLRLEFDCNFFYQDGVRSACAVMAVKYQNDSVSYTNYQLSSSSHYGMTISDMQRKGIKEVKGYFVLGKSQSDMDSKTTMQILVIRDIHLVRMHTKEVKEAKADGPVQSPTPISAVPARKDKAMNADDRVRPIQEKPATLTPPRNGGPLKPVQKEIRGEKVRE